jgi:plastocyanin
LTHLSLRHPRTYALAILFGLTPVPLALAPPAAAAPARVQAVQIRNFAFVPAVVTVAPGTIVTWTNMDEDPHTVTAAGKGFRSPALDAGDKFSFTFTTPGAFQYFCSLHPHMVGKIVVKAP